MDKSYELFKVNQHGSITLRNFFKLRCDFSINTTDSNGPKQSKLATQDYLKEAVVWYKLDLDNFEYVKKFDYFLANNRSASLDSALVRTFFNEMMPHSHGNNISKLTSELNFRFQPALDPLNYLNIASGIYLCKLTSPNLPSQLIQKVSINGRFSGSIYSCFFHLGFS